MGEKDRERQKQGTYQVGLGDAAHVDKALHRLDHLHHAPERRALVLSWSSSW